MALHCPVTCGVCKEKCKDRAADCPGWTAQALLTTHYSPLTTHHYSPRTTHHSPGTTHLSLRTTHHSPLATRCLLRTTVQGECFNNAQFMYHKCPSSCGVCEMGQCVDKNETQCAIWHDSGECERNPLAVMKECPKTCGVCTVSCMDHDPGCKGWAAATGGKLCESEEDKVRQ